MGNATKCIFAYCVARGAGGGGNLWFIFKFVKFLFTQRKCRSPNQKLLWPPNFPSFSCGPLGTWCGPLRVSYGTRWAPLPYRISETVAGHTEGPSACESVERGFFETLKRMYSSAQSISFSASDLDLPLRGVWGWGRRRRVLGLPKAPVLSVYSCSAPGHRIFAAERQ